MVVQYAQDNREVMVDRLYQYTLRDGTCVGLVGYVLIDLETGWHLKRTKRRDEAIRWAGKKGWKIVEK